MFPLALRTSRSCLGCTRVEQYFECLVFRQTNLLNSDFPKFMLQNSGSRWNSVKISYRRNRNFVGRNFAEYVKCGIPPETEFRLTEFHCTETRKPGNKETRNPENQETRKQGNKETRKRENRTHQETRNFMLTHAGLTSVRATTSAI